ncbi:MAG: phage tail tape measure protein [Eubacterium sp.]|nr:phage tail tape measure protein [Eubacterium sp.]
MGKNKEYELAIKIAGEIEKSFYESMKLTRKELWDIAEQSARASQMMSSSALEYESSLRKSLGRQLKEVEPFFSGMESAARKTFDVMSKAALATGATITAGLAASINVGSEFESAFAGVKKTVNASNAELQEMRDAIRGMAANELPMSAAELSEIAESAGQLGIRNESIIAFTETMANMSVATNLGSDEAAEEFAKFANITQMEQEYFSNLGSSVVALGNNMATTEADTVSMAMRIAAAGHQINLSEADIVAYSAALSSVGIEAEAGGSAFSKLLAKLQLATETGESLKEYARVAGMTGQEFKQAFQEDATVAINAFLTGLTDTGQNGKSAIAVLEEMGLTEVRLRDTLLRAGNANELFADALAISNQAWEENTALANEAQQRYQTFESQCQMTKNKITDLGISLYDDMRPALTEGIGLVNEFIDGLAGGEDVLGGMIESATKKMPTMVRQVKEAGEAVRDFSEPFLAVGGFLVDHPGIITGTIAGVGTALASYKIASGISSITKAFSALNPVGMTFLALGGVAAVITGIGTSVKKAAAEAKQANLDAHFGDIALSLSELQEAAAHVVGSQELDKVRESLAAMSEVDGLASDIKDAMRELNRMNWKVSVGMKLSETEQDSYREQIENYINSTQAYLTEHQYAVNLSVGVLTDSDLEGHNIVTKVNQFYYDKEKELGRIGQRLQKVINDAFLDGLLDINEIEEITQLQNQMAEIQNAFAGVEYDANLELLKTKYSFGDMDAESFRNFQAEVNEQTVAARADYEKAFIMSTANAKLMLEEGDISQKEYDKMVAEYRENYLQHIADLDLKATDIQAQAIKEQYPEIFNSDVIDQRIKNVTQGALEYIGATGNTVTGFDEYNYEVLTSGLDQSTMDAISELGEDYTPQMEEFHKMVREFREAGEAVPAEFAAGYHDTAIVGAMLGDMDSLYLLMGEEAQGSQEYRELISDLQEQGTYIPDAFAEGINRNKYIIADTMREVIKGTVETGNIQIAMKLSSTHVSSDIASMGKAGWAESYTAHADGGIFTRPHLGWIAEAGYPEAAIPIDGSRNAIDLWLKTGELLGMDGLTGGAEPLAKGIEEAAYEAMESTDVHINYNSTVQFYGGTPSQEDIENALENSYEEFERNMQKWQTNNRRKNFY